MTLASLALGTYRVQPTALPDMLTLAAAGSDSTWVDTAPNYLDGHAHTLLAPGLAQHSVPVSTKVGFLTRTVARAAAEAQVLSHDAAERGHCLSAPYVHWQCAQNRITLGRPRLNLVFAHNPEQVPGDPYDALLTAFTALEDEVAAGALDAYGVATWNGFDTGLLDVRELDRLAARAAGSPEHHLRAIQLPVSLVTAAAFAQSLDSRGPITQASRLGWSVFASAPLFGGELATLATRALADLINPELTIPQACLLAAASCPGVTHVLLSASSPAHWAQARAALHRPPASLSTLRKVLDVLAAE